MEMLRIHKERPLPKEKLNKEVPIPEEIRVLRRNMSLCHLTML